MSARSQGRRQARQNKQHRKWAEPMTQVNKKGRTPARIQPFENAPHAIMKPSRKGEGLAALRTLPE
jgi:hypothetical protein